MIVEVKVPSPGESITEVEIGTWLVEDGTVVHKDQEIAEVESDKATLTIVASDAGKITIKSAEGETVEVGAVVCTIDTSVKPEEKPEEEKPQKKDTSLEFEKEDKKQKKDEPAEKQPEIPEKKEEKEEKASKDYDQVKVTPVAKELMKEHGISVDDVIKGLKRLGKREVEAALAAKGENLESGWMQHKEASREIERKRMTPLRRKLSERLVAVKNETAMLTTFNEIDMGNVMELRKKYQQQFVEKHGFKLGFMSFFTKAVALAMDFHPMVNAQLDDDEIVSPQFVDVGIAVSTPKGLMVPIVRNAESKSIPQIELEIKELAEKARNKKISVDELSGGTFTITNGGVFGSLLSTPIINPPQSAILGMHNIVDRPVALNGQVVIRPMMYVALSYDHRIIDGKDSVGFLVRVKEFIENPERLLTGGKEAEKLLLGI
jgi:2-oxoglutarate dehydrogenase E2 component (dihydrolipoamide succinyltransferase)